MAFLLFIEVALVLYHLTTIGAEISADYSHRDKQGYQLDHVICPGLLEFPMYPIGHVDQGLLDLFAILFAHCIQDVILI